MKATWTSGITEVKFRRLIFGCELRLSLDRKWPEIIRTVVPERGCGFIFIWWDHDDTMAHNEEITLFDAGLENYQEFHKIDKDELQCIWIPKDSFNGGNYITL